MKRNDQWLQRVFNGINRNYYNNQIKGVTAVFGKVDDKDDAHFDPKTRTIVVNTDFQNHDVVAILCVVHESTHAFLSQEGYIGNCITETDNQDQYHGLRQKALIDKLYKMGAYDGLL